MSGIGKKLSDFRRNQAELYNEVAPNLIPSAAIDRGLRLPANLQYPITSYDPYNKKMVNDHPNMGRYFVPARTTDPDIQAQQDICANSTLDQLINTQNPRAPTCGWLYKAPPTDNSPYPRYSKGVLSVAGNTPPPPIFNRPEGTTLYTDLREARKVIEIDTCRALKSCDGVDNAPFKGMCGFSLWKGYGIPINSDGTAKYNDERYFTPAAQIITSASKCPVPQDEDDETTEASEAVNVCKQLPNKSLSRDCLIQKVRDAGCDNKGSLHQALAASTNPNNHASKLQGMMAYTEYQKRAMMANKPLLSEVLLRSGAGTQTDALNTFNGLYENATQVSEKTALGAAARDLCLNAGEIDSFDFCSELVDTTPMLGVDIDCIQKEWRRRGGTPSGEWYPSNTRRLPQFAKWGDYRKFLDKLFAGLDSSDIGIRADSFKRTMGVKLMNENNIIPSVRNTFPSGCRMTTEVGVNRAGGEDIQVIDTGDYQVCQKACCDNPKCNAFTHVRDSQGGKCFLKRYPTKAIPHHLGPKITSGYKQ